MNYIALLRGINVGGKNLIPMEKLKLLFKDLGFENIRTYIQSGNVLFESPEKKESVLIKKLESSLQKILDNEVAVFIRKREDFETIRSLNPFGKIDTAPDAKFYVSFLQEPLRRKPALPIVSPKKDVEIIEIKNREIFSLTAEINGRFGFPNNFVESEFDIPATTRNWNTVCKLTDLSFSD